MSRRQLPATPRPEDLPLEDKLRLVKWHRQHWPRAFRLPNGKLDTRAERRWLREQVDECLDWHEARGICRASWVATCRSWIRKTRQREGFAAQEPRSSAPNPRGKKPFTVKNDPQRLADVLPLFGEGKG